jgi:uncharacterized protein YdeI (BOF family)
MRASHVCCVCVLLLVASCHRPQGQVLGKAPAGERHTIREVRQRATPPIVTVSGVMFEKCPVAGCWLRVRDETGIIKVDTKSAGFVVVDVPLDSKVTVMGKIVTEGSEVSLEAEGLQY